jgi:hypothetical protein
MTDAALQYYLWINDQSTGPHSAEEVETMCAKGIVLETTLICTGPGEEWMPMRDHPFFGKDGSPAKGLRLAPAPPASTPMSIINPNAAIVCIVLILCTAAQMWQHAAWQAELRWHWEPREFTLQRQLMGHQPTTLEAMITRAVRAAAHSEVPHERTPSF